MNSLVIVMFMVVVVIGVTLLIFMTVTRRSGKVLDQEKYRSRWLEITQNMSDSKDSWQFAVLSGDKLLDTALRERGIPGEKMADRLKIAKSYIRNIDGVWRAHKLRNKIAHEESVSLSRRQADEALKVFRQALIDLGAL
jgi:hypothetical protein